MRFCGSTRSAAELSLLLMCKRLAGELAALFVPFVFRRRTVTVRGVRSRRLNSVPVPGNTCENWRSVDPESSNSWPTHAWERCSRFDRERDHGGRPQEEAGGGPRCDATGLDGKFPGAQGGGCLSREGETVGLQSGPDSGQEDWEATGTEAVHDEGDGRRGSIPSEFHRPCLTHRTSGVLVARIGASRAPRPRQIEAERFA